MESILNEREITPEQEEELELRLKAPQKFDPELEFRINKKSATPQKTSGYRTYTREEVAELVAASNAPHEPPPSRVNTEYPTYPREWVEQMVREHYDYLDEEKKRREERARWDSMKTIEFEPKIESTKKRSTSTKA